MGTITYHKPRGVKAVDSIKQECGADWCAKHVVAETATREAVFLVGRFHEPDSKVYVPDAEGFIKTLLVFKLSMSPRSHFNFGYKDMAETMGPCGCEAPLSILDQCSPLRDGPVEDSSLTWTRNYRERCRQLAAAKAAKRKAKPGDTVVLKEPLNFGGKQHQRFKVERTRIRRRRYGASTLSTVFRASDGHLCDIRATDLIGATITAGASQ